MNRTIKIISSLTTILIILGFSGLAFAGDVTATDANAMKAEGLAENYGWIALAAGLGIGIAALGGGIGQGRAAAAALDGIARNPSAADKLFTPMILGLALIESLVIYSLLFCFLVLGKI